MCGLAAVVGERPDVGLVPAMLRAMASRGPDDARVVTRERFSLGVCRLSIVAPDTGAQPVCSDDGAVTLGFNGELYNFREQARALLMQSGVVVRSEVELLLHRYLREGPALFGTLDGDFAIAVCDARSARCHLARDRRGVKPLHYAVLPDGGVVVASELRALLCHPAVATDWDEAALAERRVLWFTAAHRTLVRQVRQVRPGHVLEVNLSHGQGRGGVPVREVPFPPREGSTEPEASTPGSTIDGTVMVEQCSSAITQAVRRQIAHTDVEPVVVALSGGIDSSIIAAAAAAGLAPVTALTIGEPGSLDDHYARRVAKTLGIEHHLHEVTADDVLAQLPGIVLALGGSGPAYTPYFLGEAVRAHVPGAKVLLCGEGADETFAGYWMHAAPLRFLERAEQRRGSLPAGVAEESSLLGELGGLGLSPDPALAAEFVGRIFRRDQLVSAHLVPFDHATMAHGVECRVPFLDDGVHGVVERFPDLGRVVGDVGKPALRLVLARCFDDDPVLRDELLTRIPSGAPMATAAARQQLREILQVELRDAPVTRSRLAPYSRGLEDLFWLGAFEIVFMRRRGDVEKMTFADLLEGVRHAG